MKKIKTLTDLRKELQLERYDRPRTKVFVALPNGAVWTVTGIELATDAGVDAGKMSVFLTVDDVIADDDDETVVSGNV